MYLSDDERKRLGFTQVKQQQLFQRGFVLVSYNLVVAIRMNYQGRMVWVSADGYHDFSPTTARQLTQRLGTNTADRRKGNGWKLINGEQFEQICYDRIKSMNEYLKGDQ